MPRARQFPILPILTAPWLPALLFFTSNHLFLFPIPFTAEDASSCSERVDDERLFIANHNTAFSDKRVGPIIGFKLIGRRSGEYKGIVTLNGEFVRVDESALRVFDGPYTAAQFYAE